MGLRGIKVGRIVAVTLLTLALLVAGNAAYGYLTVDRPLAALLEGHSAVLDHQISRDTPGEPEVTVVLGPVKELAATYELLLAGLTEHLGPCSLAIGDQRERDPALIGFASQAQFALHEAAQDGEFVAMAGRLGDIADRAGVDLRLTVRPDRIYLTAATPDGHLYEIVDRAPYEDGGTR